MRRCRPRSRRQRTGYNANMSLPAIDVDRLTPFERLELIGRLWDSLEDGDVPVSRRERSLLDERLDRIERDGPSGVHWTEINASWKAEHAED